MKSLIEITEFDKVISYVAENAISEPGRIRTLSAQIYNDSDFIKKQIEYTTEARKLCDIDLKLPLENFTDLTKSLKDARAKLKLSAQEVWDIAIFCRNSRLVKGFLSKNSEFAPNLSILTENLLVIKDFEDRVFETFNGDLTIKESASSLLKGLYQELASTISAIKSTISKLLSDSNFTSDLRDTIYTQREGRTVFQVKAEAKNKILGIVHDVSSSGQTYFIEPKELTELHNKQREIEIKITIETDRILKSFSEEIGKYSDSLLRNQEILAETDFHFAKGKYSQKTDSCPASILDRPKIVLKAMKNPVLMRVCDNVIENDFNAGIENLCTIITGSNTGGKTVILKTIALSVLMSRAGLHVPCSQAEIYPFKNIFADIGDHQNIIQSLSTFSSHIKNLVEMTNQANSDTLILIDEICSGTDPSEGAALAKSILFHFVNQKAFSIVTTHFGELKNLALEFKGFENASVRFDTETLKPTYHFVQGISGSSNAITIAENLGLSSEIINYSREIFSQTTGKTLDKIAEIEKMWENAVKKQKEAEQDALIAKELRTKLEQQTAEMKKEKKKIISEYKKKTQSAFDSARDEIKDVLKNLRENENRENTMKSIRKNALIRKKLHDKLEEEYNTLSDEYTEIDILNIKSGDKVIIKNLNQEAEFVEFVDRGKKAQILLGSVKTIVPIKKLAAYNKDILRPKTQPIVQQKQSFEFAKQKISYTLDLRGYRYEEALNEVEMYLDKACSAGLSYAIIIHGHGTGVLKKAIRDYLSDSPYVAKFRPGEDVEGGDGVSVVDLN